MPKLKEVLVQLLEPFKISMMIFTPALLLVLGGFHFMSPTVLSQLIDLRKEEVNEAVVKEVTARIDAVVDKKLTGENIGKTTATGALTKADQEVINKSIQKQVEEETKKATKDELENLAKTLKADLYKDISLSVIFAIASIFAAFAVKDVLTEILKKEERKEVILDITSDVKEKLEKRLFNSLSKELELNLKNYSEKKIDAKIEKPIGELKEGLISIRKINRKVKEIEYEVADLTASQIPGKLTNPFILNTYLIPISLIQELIEYEPNDETTVEVLKLCRDYQLKKLQTMINEQLPIGEIRSKLEKITSYCENNQSTESLEEETFSEGLQGALDSILSIRLAQFHDLLTNLKEKGSDESEKDEIQKKIDAILDVNTPIARLLRRMSSHSDDNDFNRKNIESDTNPVIRPIPLSAPKPVVL